MALSGCAWGIYRDGLCGKKQQGRGKGRVKSSGRAGRHSQKAGGYGKEQCRCLWDALHPRGTRRRVRCRNGVQEGRRCSLIMYNKILVAYDGSDYSRAALTEAASRIKRRGGRLIILNSVYFDEEEFGNKPEQLEKRM